jgi:hypothetical protein
MLPQQEGPGAIKHIVCGILYQTGTKEFENAGVSDLYIRGSGWLSECSSFRH